MRLSTFKKIWLATYVVVLAILAIGFTSCNTVHKTTTSSNVKTDSVSIVKKEAVNVSKSDSTITKKETGSYKKVVRQWTFSTPEGEMKVTDTTNEPSSKEADNKSHGSGNLFNKPNLKDYTETRETGSHQTDEMATHSNYDTSAANEIDRNMKHSEGQTVTKKKDSKKFPFIIVGGLIAAFALVLIFLYFKRR